MYIQIVFAVKGRQPLLLDPWRQEVFKYMAGIIEAKGQKSIIVNGVADHVHILVGLRPAMAISDLVRDVKNNSSNFINGRGLLRSQFRWQNGFGSFTFLHSHMKNVYDYILNQEEHHRKETFKDEYIDLLVEHGTDYDPRYAFD
jgi:REP element-mobilizing transposase RayT